MSKGRTIIIGDVHGCIDELEALLRHVCLEPRDRLVFAGDLVDRGPASVGVVRRTRELLARHPGSACVAGNHETKALRWRDRGSPREWEQPMGEDDWAFLDSLPLIARLPEHGAMVVHGGIFPAFIERYGRVGEIPPDWRTSRDKRCDRLRRFLLVRHVDQRGEMVALGSEGRETVHWTARYGGSEGHVFFGHDPQLGEEPLRTPGATGLDTACCFGGRLTAAVLNPGQTAAEAEFASVPGTRYAEPRLMLTDAGAL